MIVDLSKKDLIHLFCGIWPSYKDMGRIASQGLGHYSGGFNDEWSWHVRDLNNLTEEELYNLYKSVNH